MREIKFRAWDGEMVYMNDYRELRLYDDHSGCIYDNRTEERIVDINSYTPLMQYTGLKDKNGKEIYEGDIVNCYKNKKGVIAYHEARAMFIIQDGYNEPLYEFVPVLEIIGNIYENPDLLSIEQNVQASVATQSDSSNKAD